jgi:hypothetical protein
MATLKQTIANRLNALRSTGPKSPEGKGRSRRNALKHGLSRLGAILPAAMADAIADRKERWRPSYLPVGPSQQWQFDRLVAESVRLDSCEHRLMALRAELAERASESWDDDRVALVAELGSKLPNRPEVIQPKLLQSRHGVLWLIERWGDVAADLERCDGWNPENWFRALDLLGVPIEGRKHSGPWDLDPNDATAGPGLELVRDGVAALQARLDAYLDDRDARSRADAESGLIDPVDSPDLRRLERYAADARRQVARHTTELRRLQALDPQSAAPAESRPSSARPQPPGPRPDRSSRRSNPSSEAAEPNRSPSEPSNLVAPTPTTSPSPSPSPARSPILTADLRGRLNGQSPSNRKARRALAAAARRS